MVVAACHARVDASSVEPDAAPDAAVDARPCTGTSDGEGNCFVLVPTAMIWNDAKAACEAMDNHLVIIRDAAQNAVLAGLTAGADTFIGATDVATVGTYYWVDGSPLTYNNFRAGTPNDGNGKYNEDCLVIEGSKTPNDTWDDRPCDPSQVPTSGKFPFVCEY